MIKDQKTTSKERGVILTRRTMSNCEVENPITTILSDVSLPYPYIVFSVFGINALIYPKIYCLIHGGIDKK